MQPDLLDLLRRDHEALERELHGLLGPTATLAQVRAHLDEVRLGLLAHAEAQEIVLAKFEAHPGLARLVREAHAVHRHQQRLLSLLLSARPTERAFRERAIVLLHTIHAHSAGDDADLLSALRAVSSVDEYRALAGTFATERLRQLTTLQPSAPVFAPFVLERAS